MNQILVISQATKYVQPGFVPSNSVFDQALVIFAIQDFGGFGVMNSSFHSLWAEEYRSSLGKTTYYIPTVAFQPFPFPIASQNILDFGQQYHEHRRQIMLARQEGLTKTYNRFHDPSETSADIAELRRLHVEIDQAVAAAYGWADRDLGHGFHTTKQGLRYTISEAARRSVLDRLLALNHERYAEEVRQGLHDKGAKKAAAKGKRGKPAAEGVEQEKLF
jgi:hypothetical protein